MRQPTDTTSKDTSCKLKSDGAELDGKVGLRGCSGLVAAIDQDSRVAVVHGCFSKEGDFILSDFSWEPLRVKLQDN